MIDLAHFIEITRSKDNYNDKTVVEVVINSEQLLDEVFQIINVEELANNTHLHEGMEKGQVDIKLTCPSANKKVLPKKEVVITYGLEKAK